MKYTLPALPYAYDALEPYIDARTMEIHYTKHHEKYVTELNAALEKDAKAAAMPLKDLLQHFDTLPPEIATAVRNNGGGHFNHSFFWPLMKKNGGVQPGGKLGQEINKKFGSFAAFKEEFSTAAKKLFGSGWAWLCINKAGNLVIMPTPNQDTPFLFDAKPILGLDVWEHAYYLKYQNKRPDYIENWWQVVNWQQAEENFNLL